MPIILPGGGSGGTTLTADELSMVQDQSADGDTTPGYETGTWTAVISADTVGDLAVVYSTQDANYTRLGNFIYAMFDVKTSTFTHSTASGKFRLTGLPFTSVNLQGSGTVSNFSPMTYEAGRTIVVAQVQRDETYILFKQIGSAVEAANTNITSVATGADLKLYVTLIYEAVV